MASEKKKVQVKSNEDDGNDDDCFEISDFSCKLTIELSNTDDEVALVAEKGQVALRDYPHPRHLCANFPYDTTPHEKYCSQCFCCVCEVAAPCLKWKGTSGHCNVSNKPSQF